MKALFTTVPIQPAISIITNCYLCQTVKGLQLLSVKNWHRPEQRTNQWAVKRHHKQNSKINLSKYCQITMKREYFTAVPDKEVYMVAITKIDNRKMHDTIGQCSSGTWEQSRALLLQVKEGAKLQVIAQVHGMCTVGTVPLQNWSAIPYIECTRSGVILLNCKFLVPPWELASHCICTSHKWSRSWPA